MHAAFVADLVITIADRLLRAAAGLLPGGSLPAIAIIAPARPAQPCAAHQVRPSSGRVGIGS
ncbi:hypothetical protein GCM10017786_11270 [Amycolatopsis deserti]|uniref:Uncharacterized protein n=1 Tax=Amycolatopsis deserti TaxID=185696 RepID=A0ABQ3IK66_9PSEU|nr:hypothetical protein GCM10017786_11270 [Amycolatopsis deserti]